MNYLNRLLQTQQWRQYWIHTIKKGKENCEIFPSNSLLELLLVFTFLVVILQNKIKSHKSLDEDWTIRILIISEGSFIQREIIIKSSFNAPLDMSFFPRIPPWDLNIPQNLPGISVFLVYLLAILLSLNTPYRDSSIFPYLPGILLPGQNTSLGPQWPI